jgi:hypothetical protein
MFSSTVKLVSVLKERGLLPSGSKFGSYKKSETRFSFKHTEAEISVNEYIKLSPYLTESTPRQHDATHSVSTLRGNDRCLS